MYSLSWRSILYFITFVLFALAIVFWVLTLVGWLITEPGFEPLNVLVGALVSSLGGLLTLLRARIAEDTPISNTLEYSPTLEQCQRNRRAMLERVKNDWIKGVLEKPLHAAAMIELGLEERVDAVERPWDMVVQTPDRPKRLLPRGTKIANVFDEMNQALLILGEPGSGKTTMLLELARDKIASAEKEPAQPIPVVFHLSSWTDKGQSISDWLVHELNAKYNIQKRIACSWVENDDLLLLFDGLDEVESEHREACVEAINDFRQEHGLTPLVVCSRIADYEALTTRLKLRGAVLLQPLTPQQVDDYLANACPELAALRTALQDEVSLQELARSPLILSIMVLVHQGMSVENLQSLNSVEARRKSLFDAYVRRMFEHRGADQRYSPEQTIHWLAWLAQKMSQHSQAVFLIERMQPSWLQRDAPKQLYDIGSGLIFGIGFGLIFGLVGGLSSGLVGGIILGLILGPLLEPMSGLLPESVSTNPSTEEDTHTVRKVSKWSRVIASKVLNGLIPGLAIGLILGLAFWLSTGLTYGLILGLISGLTFGLAFGLFLGLTDVVFSDLSSSWGISGETIQPVEALKWSWAAAIFGLISYVISKMVFLASSWLSMLILEPILEPSVILAVPTSVLEPMMLVVGLSFGLSRVEIEVTRAEIETRRIPNQGIRQSAKNATLFGLLGGLTALSGLIFGVVSIVNTGLLLGLVLGLYFGGFAFLQHVILRFILWYDGHIPWNYAHFLDYATEHIFLRRVGGGYIFVHGLLLEYFASLEAKQI